MNRRAARAVLAAALIAPMTASATTQYGNVIMQRWNASDRCVAQAQKQFPDYSAEGIAKRDRAVQQCLTGGLLPPRQPQTPGGNPQQ
jgi:hypothetical protein